MKPALKSLLIASGVFVGTLIVLEAPARAASALDIGTDYRLRGISTTKADYGLTPDQNYNYYSQRLMAHIGGRFSPNIEFMTQFQALGVAGSSASVTNPAIDTTQGRYPNTNFTPWVQLAYFKASNLYDMPIDLTIGRQSIILGDGMILSDDNLGFTGIRADSRLPWYGLQANLFAFRPADTLVGSASKNIYGLEMTKPAHAIRYQASVVNERDSTGTTYIRPSENASTFNARYKNFYPTGTTPPPLLSQFNFSASNITKTFYDARVEGHLLQGGFYKFEGAIQSGHVSRDPSLATSSATALGYSSDVNLSGYAFLVSGGLFTNLSKYGPIEIHGTFGLASGDSGGGSDSAFNPSYAHRFDGLERSGFGEYYGASLYDAVPSASYNTFSSTPTTSGLPPGFSGLRVIGAGVTTHPTSLLSIGIDYYVYSAQETANNTFTTSSSDSSLGTELDFGVGLAYTNYLSFKGFFALFSPGSAYPSQNKVSKILLEATGRF